MASPESSHLDVGVSQSGGDTRDPRATRGEEEVNSIVRSTKINDLHASRGPVRSRSVRSGVVKTSETKGEEVESRGSYPGPCVVH